LLDRPDRIPGEERDKAAAGKSTRDEPAYPRGKGSEFYEMMRDYFARIEKRVKSEYEICQKARSRGFDPEDKVDIPVAKGISERVEGLVSAAAPEILGSGVAERIVKLEKKYGQLDWRVALTIAEEVAKQKFCKFKTEKDAMEVAVRVGLAYVTLGVISAPLEGFIELKVRNRKDGGKYVAAFYAGPIRAAGGTAAAVSLIIADYVRMRMGYQKYDPTDKEIQRTILEVRDYHERATNLQYFPSEEELEFLVKNLPIQVDGDPTEEIDVSNYKDLDRVETNKIRGGLCLVLAEGLAQKAKKLKKQLDKWGKEMDLDWTFINEFLNIQKRIRAKGESKSKDDAKISPNYTYISDLVAGRPVFSLPLRSGGFRLRYGRSRITGLACAAIHPTTMHILNNYVATGTQLKVERPGKAAAIVPCDQLEGPIVKLKDGSVKLIETIQDAKQCKNEIQQIIYLGDILFSYGDFSENNHRLVPVGYCEEWWIQEFENAIIDLFGSLDYEKTAEMVGTAAENLELLFKNPIDTRISPKLAMMVSSVFGVPLHPRYTYHWKTATVEEINKLVLSISNSKIIRDENNKILKIIIPEEQGVKGVLEKAGIPHLFINKEYIVIEKPEAEIFSWLIGKSPENGPSPLENVSRLFGVRIRDKGGTFIGARMGRPEKAKQRKLTGSPHVLFPVGKEGGKMRSFQSALESGKVSADFPTRVCRKCQKETIYAICEGCGKASERQMKADKPYSFRSIDIKHYFSKATELLNEPIYPDLIKGVKGTSNKDHVPEHLLKGILRAKHSVHVNKDGTTRYDMIELPITHFRPKEINTTIEKLKELGYTKDIRGVELTDPDQILELLPQDNILPNSTDSPDEKCQDVLFRVGNFIDELLVKLYGLAPYYNFQTKDDVIGQFIIGLAPHTSAGIVGRIIGFSNTQGMFTHPLFHAAMRRNCDGDEACVMLLMDGLLNFSRSYLPDRRGSRTMDAPLVLTYILVPSEVDTEVHGLDIVWRYPLELYNAAEEYRYPYEVEVLQVGKCLDTDRQYRGYGFTHNISNLNLGVTCSSYKTLPSMEEKLLGQMDLAEKIRAVDTPVVAELVVEKHFLKDIKGNLRKYSMQSFRCVECNDKYRRPPLLGRCSCGGKIIYTISDGSILKYLEPSKSLLNKYGTSSYLKQNLELLERTVTSVLGQDKEKQEGLGRWFG
jgi:DNA polymerase II large subunit